MPEPVKKKDAYAKRNSLGITVPLEGDSDSDFAPGPYIPTPAKPKTKKLTKKRGSVRIKREIPSDEEEIPVPAKKKKTSSGPKNNVYRGPPIGSNLLEELFAKASFRVNYSSGEEAEDEEEDGSDDEEEEEEDWSGSEAPDSPPPVLKSNLPSKQPALAPPPNDEDSETEPESDPPPPAKPAAQTLAAIQADSETEPESDVPQPLPKRKASPVSLDSHPSKRQKTSPVVDDESVTESESEVDEPRTVQARAPAKAPATQAQDDDSVTESESDDDLIWRSKPRPDFPLKPGQSRLGRFTLDQKQGISVPGPINTYLRPYQRDGVSFFWRQYKDGYGGLLGDDMGLGKTIQVISFLSAIMKKTGTIADQERRREHVSRLQDGPDWDKRRQLPPANKTWPTCLIIAPSTVCHNWEREFETWGYFEVGMYTGDLKTRTDVLKDFKMGRLDVVITSFDIALRDNELLCDEAWSCVIIDEVHRVKNEKSNTTRVFHQFPRRGRFGLTGTTIQNSYNEMWNILDWTNPGRVGASKQWKKYVTKPLTLGQSASATAAQRALKQVVADTLTKQLLPQVFLRRTKDVIKGQLPQKFDNVVFCPLTKIQIGVYKRVLEMDNVQNMVKRDRRCDCGSKNKRKDCCYPFDARDLFRFMTVLIKLSNHMALILPNRDDGEEQYERDKEVARAVLPGAYKGMKQGVGLMEPNLCGKWKTLEALLKKWKKDPTNKVLIFTKSVKLLQALNHYLDTHNYQFVSLDGSTRQSERMSRIDKFQLDPDVFVFLISTLAGGTGLNLTAANKVVIFDPNWNPAHDLQAMDRAFRFGQKRDVTVVRLLAAGSLEELVYARQIYKQQQMAIGYEASVQTRYFDGVQGDTTKRGELFGLENIFKLQEDKIPTKYIIEEAKLLEADWANPIPRGGSRKGHHSQGANSDVLDAENRIGGDEAELKGLASFLFDDALTPKVKTGQEELQEVLAGAGGMYSHVNDEVLAESRAEKERLGKSSKGTRQRKSTTGGKQSTAKNAAKEKPPGPWWPPRRKKNTTDETVESQIQARREAFVAKGYISGSSTEADLAKRMKTTMTKAEREALFKEMDAWLSAARG